MVKKFAIALVLIILVVGVVVLNGLRRDDGKGLLHVADEAPFIVEAAKPVRKEMVRVVQAPGRIEPVKEVEISSQVVARIDRMAVEEGDVVHVGDLLCELDDDDFQAEVESGKAKVAALKAGIQRAQAEADKHRRHYAHAERLAAQDATTDFEFADYVAALAVAEANLEAAKQQLVEAQASLKAGEEKLKKTVIVSPIDGVVAALKAKQGEVVVTGTMNNPGTIIMDVCDLSKMQIRTFIDETDVALVKPDQPARVYLQSDSESSFPGRVWKIAPKGTRKINRDVVTFETLILIESKDPKIKPAMNANVEIEVKRSENALAIPIEAVVYRKPEQLPKDRRAIPGSAPAGKGGPTSKNAPGRRLAQYVKVIYCMVDERAVVKRVKTGISDRENVEIISGLNAEDVVITGPYRSLDRLKHGRAVKLKPGSETKTDQVPEGKDAGEGKTAQNSHDDGRPTTSQATRAASQPARNDGDRAVKESDE